MNWQSATSFVVHDCVYEWVRECAFPFAIVLTAGANYAMSFGQCAHSPPTLYSDRWNPMENLENSIGCDTTLIQRQYLHTNTHTHVTHSLDVLHRMQYQPLTLICNIFIILTTTLEIPLRVCVWLYRFGCAWVNCWRGYCVKYQL